MKNTMTRQVLRVIFFSLLALYTMVSTSHALDVYLRAEALNKTMPDGTIVPMWGYAQCDNTFTNCCAASVPGPAITVPVGDNLTIHLQNTLSEATSIVIPGQALPTGGAGPVRNLDGRARSFVHETDPSGTADYVWSTIRPGTYLYESGTHPSVQVQMGLYGALEKNNAAGAAYPGVTYANDAILLFSEIDPALHAAVAGGTYGTVAYPSTMNYLAKYFLINGEPYSASRPPVSVGAAGSDKLLRFLSAGLKTHTPTVHGRYVLSVAEDGYPYAFPMERYSLSLHPGKTLDAVLRGADIPVPALIPLYDRSLGLSNSGATPGGMLAYLRVGAVPQYTLTVTKAGTGTGTVQTGPCSVGGIDCGADCTEIYPEGTAVTLVAIPDVGSYFVGWSGGGCSGTGSCAVTMGADTTVTATFNLNPVLTVVRAGAGTGAVQTVDGTLTPIPGIDCGVDCTETYPYGTLVTLSATPGPNSFFAGWSGGGCSGTGTCVVTMNAAMTVTATFNLNTSLTLLVPNGGENWRRGAANTVIWSYSGNLGSTVRLELLKGVTVQGAVTAPIGAGGIGSYNWTIPAVIPLGNDFRVRVTSIVNAAYTDTSDNNFTISTTGTACTYTLNPTSANMAIGAGAGNFTVTTQTGCAWAASTASPWIAVTSPTGLTVGSGTVNFTVTDNTGAPARTGTIVLNGRTFTVNQAGTGPAASITVTYPNGGESIRRGTNMVIQWTYTGAPGATVRVELLRNGALVQTIAANAPVGTAGSGSFTATVPFSMPLGGGYSVRVTSTSNAAYTDTSNATFTISP